MATLKKADMVAFPILLGIRTGKVDDVSAFYFALGRQLAAYEDQQFPCLDFDNSVDLARQFSAFKNVMIQVVKNAKNPLVIFPILTMKLAKEREVMPAFLVELSAAAKDEHRVYPIILDGSDSSLWTDVMGEMDLSEILGGEAIHCAMAVEDEAYTPGCRRVVELMNRLMGADLPGDDFPDYTLADRTRIAEHINEENFNSIGVKEGAIPKYNIGLDGRPNFPELYKIIECPGCGARYRIYRECRLIDKDGNLKWDCSIAHKWWMIPLQFDAWPELDAMRAR